MVHAVVTERRAAPHVGAVGRRVTLGATAHLVRLYKGVHIVGHLAVTSEEVVDGPAVVGAEKPHAAGVVVHADGDKGVLTECIEPQTKAEGGLYLDVGPAPGHRHVPGGAPHR